MSATNSAPLRQSGSRPTLAGVLYAEDFDDDASTPPHAQEQAPEPEVIEPVFTTAELEAARDEGRAAGRAEAEHGVAASRMQILRLIAVGISEAQEAAQQTAEQAAEAAARCMLTSLAACLPALCARHGAEELRALVRVVLPALMDEPRVTIRVHPHMVLLVQQELASLDDEVADRISVQSSEAIMPGDAKVSWSDGLAIRNSTRAQAAVTEALALLDLLEPQTLLAETIDA